MSAILKIENLSPSIIVEKSYLDADTSAGPSAVVKSASNMAVSQYALIGALGRELTELVRITVITTNTLTVSPSLSNSHDKYTDVTVLRVNQIKIYRASNVDGNVPADGDFTVLATVGIDTDDVVTTYSDSSGGSDYWYKFTYYNSQTSVETAIGDSIATRGAQANNYATIDGIIRAAGFTNNVHLSDSVIAEKRSTAEDEINASLGGTYTVPFTEPFSPTIVNIVEQLAAGMLLLDEYGVFASGTTKDGQAKIDAARAQLKILKDQGSELTDSEGNTLVTSSRIDGWPDDSTADLRTEDDGGARMFRIMDKY